MHSTSFIAITLITVFAPLVAEEDSGSKQFRLMISALEFVLDIETRELANQQIIKVEDELSVLEGKVASSRKRQASHRKTIAEEALNREDRGQLMKQIRDEEKLTKTLRKSLADEEKLIPRKISMAMAEAKKRNRSLDRGARKLLAKKAQREKWTWEAVEKNLRESAELPEKTMASSAKRIQELKEILADAELDPKTSSSKYSKACKQMQLKAKIKSQLAILNARLDRKRRNVNHQHPATIDYLMNRDLQTQQVTGFTDRGKAWRIRCRLCEKILREYIAMLQSKVTFLRKYRSLFPREAEATAADYSTAQKLLKWIQKFDTITFYPPEVVTL
ncbi:MAG: hypothetical protein QGG53_40715 [Planctomycetota bacterium]|jgi:hypothetical protein|nr:hypothetical protein [Planctomycetota bacterium]